MGLLVDGQWQDKWYDTDSSGGRFERSEAGFRHWITADGSAGPVVRQVLQQKQVAIIYMPATPVPGCIAR